MTTLRDATLALERGVNDILGDEITYRFAPGLSQTFNAWVEFDTEAVGTGHSSSQTDAVTVEVPIAIVAEPATTHRITVAVLPGKTWAMARRTRGAGGATWIIALKRAEP